MHPLPDGGFVVDTPGLREIGVWNLRSGDLDHCFLEFRPFLGHCRFGDCRHVREPGCRVRAAPWTKHRSVASRYDSYLKLLASWRKPRRTSIEHYSRSPRNAARDPPRS